MYVNNIAALIALASPSGEYIVGGHTTPGDGGGGTFIWIPTISAPSVTQDFGIIFFSTTTVYGYFQRLYSGPINVKWFGAKGDNGSTDDTAAVHAARSSMAFANNGTLYFPIGTYMGAFVFDYNPSKDLNEINIIGDGQGTILKSNKTIDPNTGDHNPVLRLGYREWEWQWARVSNLSIHGSFDSDPVNDYWDRWSNGVLYDNPNDPTRTGISGRWVFERVFFYGCNYGVYKWDNNFGNHYIDCSWYKNNYGVYAIGTVDGNNGSDRYSGCEFTKSTEAAIYYRGGTLGQIIFDGTDFEQNYGYGIKIECSVESRLLKDAICIRNVYFEDNNKYNIGASDIYLNGIKSVRIEDSFISTMELIDSSVNMFNCRQDGNFPHEGDEYTNIKVDDTSSVVAYEHRYKGYPGDKIYVHSISYDNTPEPGGGNSIWTPTSVWGPLRAVLNTRINDIVVSEQFDTSDQIFNHFNTSTYAVDSIVDPMHVLGIGSGKLNLTTAVNWVQWSIMNDISQHNRPRYCVWSIHTYLETDMPVEKIYGSIISEDPIDQNQLGYVYFKYNQWVCSYGMKMVDTTVHPKKMRLVFRTIGHDATFYFTDYQIIMFDDLHSANSFVNSKEFAKKASKE